MNKFRAITLPEFIWLVENAQMTHYAKKEPIPLLLPTNYDRADSCLKTPFQTFGGRHLYQGFMRKAAVLFYLLNKNHVLSNGNKRMACLTLGYFCYINGKTLTIPSDRFYLLAGYVTESDAARNDFIIDRIIDILRPHIR